LIEARILSVSDVVEVMASHGPYRPALGLEVALKEIDSKKGELYDYEVAQVCLDLYDKKELVFQ